MDHFSTPIRQLSFTLLCLILITSCAPEKEQVAADLVGNMWQAKRSTVTLPAAGENSKAGSTVTLSLEGIRAVKTDYPRPFITSISALAFISNLPQEEFTKYDSIHVKLNQSASSYEKSYKIKDLLLAIELQTLVDSFGQKLIRSEHQSLDPFLDKAYLDDSTLSAVKQVLHSVDSAYGAPEKLTTIGFEFNTLEESHEPVYIVHAELANKKAAGKYKLIFKLSTKKIIYLAMNEKL